VADVNGTTLKWGIIGAGTPQPAGHSIAHAFARGVLASDTGGLLAIGSRSRAKAEQFGDTFGVPRRYDSYAALLDDPEVQAIYIALPNHLHKEWAIKCAAAGKHILCEKPLALNRAEAMEVLAAARRHDVFLMEAFMYRCHPQTARLKALVEGGVIGEVQLIEAAFSYDLGPHPENVRLSNPMGGGGIMDVGCYAVSMARLINGAEPVTVTGVARVGARSHVDEVAAATLLFPNGVVASVAGGLGVDVDTTVHIWGAAGSIHVPNPWKPVAGENRIRLQRKGGAVEEIVIEGGNDLYALEADTVARHLAARQAPQVTWDDSLGNMAVLDAWRQAAGVVFEPERPKALRGPAPARQADAPMTYGSIPGVDMPISRLLMGTASFTPRDLPVVCALLDHFAALGGNAIDTAHQYGRGASERAIGQWMALRGNRADMVIVSKCCREEVLGRGLRVTPAAITSDLTDSLERLGTDYIDIYMLHTDDPTQPVGPIVECLNAHYRTGRIRAFGGSNWSPDRLDAANAYARERGLVPFAVGSPNFSLGVWNQGEPPWPGCLSASDDGRDWYVRHASPLISWSSQAQGFFTGRYAPDDRSDEEITRVWYNVENFARLGRARELGRRHGVSANAIALAYVLCQPFPTFAIIGPRRLDEMDSSATALAVRLTPEDLEWLSRGIENLAPLRA